MPTAETIKVAIHRQASPDAKPVIERFEIPYRPNMNITSLLGEIALNPVDVTGAPTTPITYDSNCLEEICGSCAMLINGKAMMACSALVDKLLAQHDTITLAPLSKFPVVRDLAVDRSVLFENLKAVKAWVPIDGSYNLGPGPRQQPQIQEARYPLSNCISCTICMEVCPQFNDVTGFVGAATIAQARLFNMDPAGSVLEGRPSPRSRRRRRHPGVRLRAELRPGLPQATPPHRGHQRHGPRRLHPAGEGPVYALRIRSTNRRAPRQAGLLLLMSGNLLRPNLFCKDRAAGDFARINMFLVLPALGHLHRLAVQLLLRCLVHAGHRAAGILNRLMRGPCCCFGRIESGCHGSPLL